MQAFMVQQDLSMWPLGCKGSFIVCGHIILLGCTIEIDLFAPEVLCSFRIPTERAMKGKEFL